MQQPSSTKSGGRRKSAFAEEEEGYMFVEEGFRIRFANGEVIDFYADSREQKEGWMKVLSECVGKDIASGRGWAEMVLEKERQEKPRSHPGAQFGQIKPQRESMHANGQQQRPRSHEGPGSQSVPTSPVKHHGHSRTKSHVPAPPPPISKDAEHKAATAPRRKEVPSGKINRRDQVRSMIF